uniref:PIN-like domain-containing protein n=1 Tax=viral metagenome TaxID=1070528 RepID=A0A6C0I941_9ZZZZ
MKYILLDADNINIELFVKDVFPKIQYQFGKETYHINIYCQTNIIFKHLSSFDISVNLKCTKYKNKNSTDAHILFECGRLVNDDNMIIIVSDDKIFSEITNDRNIFQIGVCDFNKKMKLNKINLLSLIERLYKDSNYSLSYDIFLDDLVKYFKNVGISDIENLINSGVPELGISKTNVIYKRIHK